jgi:hypothetical protein
MVIYMIETRIIIAIFNAHYPLRAELGKILEVLVLEYDFGGTRTRTRGVGTPTRTRTRGVGTRTRTRTRGVGTRTRTRTRGVGTRTRTRTRETAYLPSSGAGQNFAPGPKFL